MKSHTDVGCGENVGADGPLNPDAPERSTGCVAVAGRRMTMNKTLRYLLTFTPTMGTEAVSVA